MVWLESPDQFPRRALSVQLWDGMEWHSLDTEFPDGLFPGEDTSGALVEFMGGETPVLAYSVRNVGAIHVLQWTGGSWQPLGTGGASGEAFTRSSEDPWDYSLASDDSGRVLLAWQSGRNVRLHRFTGSAWEELGASVTALPASGSAYATLPCLSFDSDGSPVVFWNQTDITVGNPQGVRARRWTGTSWEDMVAGAGPEGFLTESYVRVIRSHRDSSGRLSVLWAAALGPPGLYLRRWSGTEWESPRWLGQSLMLGTGRHGEIHRLNPDTSDFEVWDGAAWQLVPVEQGVLTDPLFDHLDRGETVYGGMRLDSAGHAVLAFTGSQRRVIARRFTGTRWEGIGDGSVVRGGLSSAGVPCSSPALVVSESGDPVVAHLEDFPSLLFAGSEGVSLRLLRVRRWRDGSWQEVGTPFGVYELSEDGDQTIPAYRGRLIALAAGSSDELFLAFCSRADKDGEIVFSHWDGTRWRGLSATGASLDFVSDSEDVDSAEPALALDPDGRPVIAWREGLHIFAKRWTGSEWAEIGPGSASGTGLSLSDYGDHPAVACLPDGRVFVGWGHGGLLQWDGAGWQGLGYFLRTVGVLTDQVVLVPDLSGNLLVAWQVQTTSSFSIRRPPGIPYIRRGRIHILRLVGSTWEEVGDLGDQGIAEDEMLPQFPALAPGPQGQVIASWDLSFGGGSALQLRQFEGGRWSEVETRPNYISAASGRSYLDYPVYIEASSALSSDPLGNPVIAWVQGSEVFLETAGPGLHVAGSANGDSVVDIADLVAFLNHINGIPITYAPAFENADVDGDGDVDTADGAAILDIILTAH